MSALSTHLLFAALPAGRLRARSVAFQPSAVGMYRLLRAENLDRRAVSSAASPSRSAVLCSPPGPFRHRRRGVDPVGLLAVAEIQRGGAGRLAAAAAVGAF